MAKMDIGRGSSSDVLKDRFDPVQWVVHLGHNADVVRANPELLQSLISAVLEYIGDICRGRLLGDVRATAGMSEYLRDSIAPDGVYCSSAAAAIVPIRKDASEVLIIGKIRMSQRLIKAYQQLGPEVGQHHTIDWVLPKRYWPTPDTLFELDLPVQLQRPDKTPLRAEAATVTVKGVPTFIVPEVGQALAEQLLVGRGAAVVERSFPRHPAGMLQGGAYTFKVHHSSNPMKLQGEVPMIDEVGRRFGSVHLHLERAPLPAVVQVQGLAVGPPPDGELRSVPRTHPARWAGKQQQQQQRKQQNRPPPQQQRQQPNSQQQRMPQQPSGGDQPPRRQAMISDYVRSALDQAARQQAAPPASATAQGQPAPQGGEAGASTSAAAPGADANPAQQQRQQQQPKPHQQHGHAATLGKRTLESRASAPLHKNFAACGDLLGVNHEDADTPIAEAAPVAARAAAAVQPSAAGPSGAAPPPASSAGAGAPALVPPPPSQSMDAGDGPLADADTEMATADGPDPKGGGEGGSGHH